MPRSDWDPLKELVSVQQRMNKLFESALARTNFDDESGVGAWTPVADVFETDERIVFCLELPGLELADIDLKMDGDELVVQGERRMDNRPHARCARCPPGRPRARGEAQARRARPRARAAADTLAPACRAAPRRPRQVSRSGRPFATDMPAELSDRMQATDAEALAARVACGDADRALREADAVLRESFDVQRHTEVPMETRGTLAEWDAGRGVLSLWGMTKVPHVNRRIIAEYAGLPEHRVHFLPTDVGGAFGVRN